jgi:hypothetical protein
MSPDNADDGQTSGAGLDVLWKKGNELMSPRQNAASTTVLTHTLEFGKRIWELLKYTTATVVDAPLGLAEATIATVNNTIGLLTSGVDRMIVQPIDWTRAKVFDVLNHPSSLFTAGGPHTAPAHA